MLHLSQSPPNFGRQVRCCQLQKHINLVHHRLILARSCHRTCLNRANHHLILPPGALLSATKTCKSCKPQANSGLQPPPYMLKLSQSAANSGLQLRCCQMRKHSKTSFRCPPSQVSWSCPWVGFLAVFCFCKLLRLNDVKRLNHY